MVAADLTQGDGSGLVAVKQFIELAKELDPRRLVFIDEAASHIAMTREYARAARGERAHGSVPVQRGHRHHHDRRWTSSTVRTPPAWLAHCGYSGQLK